LELGTLSERHYWDTCIWLDLTQEPEAPAGPVRTLWNAVQQGSIELLFSAITLAEVLVRQENTPRPWDDPHDADALFDAEGLFLVQVDRIIGERARSLRRKHTLKTPDAIHLACGIEYDVDFLITRDGNDLLKLPQQYRKDGKPLAIVTPAEALGGPLFKKG
jgi:predicted nucleic acid-binding protein